jgi:hypothetical protein
VGEHLLQLAAVLLANLGCAILGGVIGSAQTGRASASAPCRVATTSDGPGEETSGRSDRRIRSRQRWPRNGGTTHRAGLVEVPDPEPQTGMWPVPKTQRLDLLDG